MVKACMVIKGLLGHAIRIALIDFCFYPFSQNEDGDFQGFGPDFLFVGQS
jgi:hypothetical protein